MRTPSLGYLGLALLVTLGGCAGESAEEAMPVRPVTVLDLVEQEPVVEREMTGAVSLYRQEEISFEVGGQVLSVQDVGIEVRGPAFDEDNRLVRQGEPIARLENTRFRARAKSAEAQVSAAEDDLAAASSELTLAEQTLTRQVQVLADGAGSQQAVDAAQSAYDRAAAGVEARRAAVAAAQEQLRLATENLADTTLYAPFNGRITAVHTGRGAVVSPGSPVVTLTLMDPLYVRVEVSADEERQIQTGHRGVVTPKDPLDRDTRREVSGIVFEKSAVADDRLRTFQIDLIVRNRRQWAGRDGSDLPLVSEYSPVIREYEGEEGPLYVQTTSVLRENGRAYVLRLPGVAINERGRRDAVGRHSPERVEVELGDQYTSVIEWNFRSLKDPGDLEEGDILIARADRVHLGGVVIGRPQWLLRPGDLVPVRFQLESAPLGIYVPVSAITRVGGQPAVFLVDDEKARAQPVTVHESSGELRRVEGVEAGQRLIVRGHHYVSHGQPVQVVSP
ncbi:MAG: efflux RND transporter periplasmic adaptor subunit [Acidobacteriota bacterium]